MRGEAGRDWAGVAGYEEEGVGRPEHRVVNPDPKVCQSFGCIRIRKDPNKNFM